MLPQPLDNLEALALKEGPDDWHVKLGTSEVIRRSPSITLNEADAALFHDGTTKYQSGEQYTVPDLYLACLHRSQLHNGTTIVVSPQNRASLRATMAKEGTIEDGLLTKLKLPWGRKLSGDYVFLSHPWANAYYHWLIEVLPRLALVEISPDLRTLPLVVPPKLSRFQTDSLRIAGIASDRLIQIEYPRCTVDRLYVPGELGRSGNPTPQAVTWLRQTFLGKRDHSQKRHRRLYITRRDAKQRRVVNEPEVIAFLRKNGFEVICPGDYPFAQQIALFDDVDIVVAPHGAGLTNMTFAPRGAKLLELFGSNYINGCYWALANLCGQFHAALVAPTQTLDYSVSLDRLEKLLEKFDRCTTDFGQKDCAQQTSTQS